MSALPDFWGQAFLHYKLAYDLALHDDHLFYYWRKGLARRQHKSETSKICPSVKWLIKGEDILCTAVKEARAMQ